MAITHQTLWTLRHLRCILIIMSKPECFTVHVLDGDSPVCMERYQNADDAVAAAERLRAMFDEPVVRKAPLKFPQRP